MRSPCHTCERSLLNKDECSLGCELRHEYCQHLGISVTGALPSLVIRKEKPKSCSSVRSEQVPYKRQVVGSTPTRTTKEPVPKVPKPPRPPNPPKPPKPPYDWHAPRGMRSKGGRLEKATGLMKEGCGNQETCRLTGMSKNTAAKLRRVLEVQNGGPFLCGCGKSATHPGWCSYRFAKSPKRQATVLKFSLGKDTPSKMLP